MTSYRKFYCYIYRYMTDNMVKEMVIVMEK